MNGQKAAVIIRTNPPFILFAIRRPAGTSSLSHHLFCLIRSSPSRVTCHMVLLLMLLQRLPRSLHTTVPSSQSLLHPRPSGAVGSDSQAAESDADTAVAAETDAAAAAARQSQQSPGSATGNQFLGFLYFSPVAPLGSHGNPPSRIMFIEMHMQRSGRLFGDRFLTLGPILKMFVD
jgi:hypothetical protein